MGEYVYEEKESFDEHKPLRDQMATFEYEIAEHLRNMKYDVLGTHLKGTIVSQSTLEELRLKGPGQKRRCNLLLKLQSNSEEKLLHTFKD